MDSIPFWMREWKIKLNIIQSIVVHFGKSNLETNYQIQYEYFNYKILENRDLGINV